MAWGHGNLVGGGASNKSMIIATIPEGTTRAYCTYAGKTVNAQQKDGKWIMSGLNFGPDVTWTVHASNGTESAELAVPMPRLEIKYVSLVYWDGSLYNAGNEYPEITGGWGVRAWSAKNSWLAHAPVAQKLSDRVKLTMPGRQNNSGVFEVLKDIDLTKYTRICARCNALQFDWDTQTFALVAVNRDASQWRGNAAAFGGISAAGNQTITIDIGSLTGRYDVAIGMQNYASADTVVDLFRVWVE